MGLCLYMHIALAVASFEFFSVQCIAQSIKSTLLYTCIYNYIYLAVLLGEN